MMRTTAVWTTLRVLTCSVVISSCAISIGFAQESDGGESKNNTVTIYLWGASISGDLSFPAGSQSFDVSLEQILDNLDLAAMVAYTRDFGDWSILLDVIYLNLGADNNGTVTVPTEDGGSVEIDVDADLDLKTWIGGLYGGYTFARSGPASHRFIAGVRYLSLDADLSLDVSDTAGDELNGRAFSTSARLFDGVIGFQGQFDLGGRWRLPYHFDIGTGDSQITYQSFAGVGYVFGWGNLSLTYRYIYYDQGNDGVIHELTMDGPMAAVAFRF